MKYLCYFSLLLVFFSSQITAQNSPNIVFILTDDLGYTDLGCYGNPFNNTPYLDTLAMKGLLFTQAYAASPICSPSRAAILTGKHPARLKLTNFIKGERKDANSPIDPAPYQPYLDAKEITLAEKLKEAGYHTGMVGKWHLGTDKGQLPWDQGFDFSRMIGKNGLDYYNYSIFEDSFEKAFEDDGTNYLTDKLTDYALEFIAQKREKPYFLYLAYSAPHVLIIPRGDKLKPYLFKYNKFEGAYNPYYAAMIESIDDGVGAIYNRIKDRGELENTLFIFTSDNGGLGLDELGPVPTNLAPLRKWKGHIYEGGSRIPAIVSWKGKIPDGVKSDFSFSNVDYMETILSIIGKPYQPSNDSRNIKPAFFDPDIKNSDWPIYWHYPHFSNQMGRPAAAIRWGDFKLVERYENNRLELYNIAEDISESRDLSLEKPQLVQQLFEKLNAWRTDVQANMPIRK